MGEAAPRAESADYSSMSEEEAIAALGYAAATTRWHLPVEGGFAWYLAGSAFPLRARHFGAPPLAGCHPA